MKPSSAILPPSLSPDDPDYQRERFSVKQAAAYLLVHASSVYRDAAAGRLGHRRDGSRRLRFSQADLDAWRAARRVESPSLVLGKVERPRLTPPLRLPRVRRFGS